MTFKMCINREEFGVFLIENLTEEIQSHCITEKILVTCPLVIRSLRECEVLLMMGLVQKTEYRQIKTWERRRREKGRIAPNNICKSLKDFQKTCFGLVWRIKPKPKDRNFIRK